MALIDGKEAESVNFSVGTFQSLIVLGARSNSEQSKYSGHLGQSFNIDCAVSLLGLRARVGTLKNPENPQIIGGFCGVLALASRFLGQFTLRSRSSRTGNLQPMITDSQGNKATLLV